jgi:type II secretory pathway pseudopilin PulG
MRGFTYLGLLIAIAIMSVTLAATAIVWHTANQREKEKELLFVGGEFQRAIGAYYKAGPGGAKQYPRRLEDLVRDPRYLEVRRYLRKVYVDPMTGKAKWGLIKGADGGIAGVHSLAPGKPFKHANFPPALDLGQAGRYSDWKFLASALQSSGGSADGKGTPGSGTASTATSTASGGSPVANPPLSEQRPECVAQLAADRAACAAARSRNADEGYLCEARIPARLAACLQRRELPGLIVGS